MVQKYGRQNGLQRYRCRGCDSFFRSKRKPSVAARNLWKAYAYKRQTVADLAETAGLSPRQVRRVLKEAVPAPAPVPEIPGTAVIAMDTTYFREGGVMVFRCPTRKKNLFWKFVREETNGLYLAGLGALEAEGWRIPVVVCDGKKWLAETLEMRGYAVQLCQFHLVKTVTRYLTRHPALDAGRELRALSFTLRSSTGKTFTEAFDAWQERWRVLLKERTTDQATGRWQYTHRRIRSAAAAIRRTLPYLFTFERHPEIYIPNTTNTLDGSFSQLKQKVHVHRGLNAATKRKMIETILSRPSIRKKSR